MPLSRIRPNPYQPRREFDPAELAELEASLKASGLLQPITVRRVDDAFELIAGERRFRAATKLGWNEIPAIVRDLDDRTMLVLALVENLQRADLNAIEEARGYKRLADDFGYAHAQIADAVGKDRTTVTNLIRLLALPASVQQMLEQRLLTAGHARALLGLNDEKGMRELAQEIVAKGLTVRDVEQRARGGEPAQRRGELAGRQPGAVGGIGGGGEGAPSAPLDPTLRAIQDELRRHFQTDVQVVVQGGEKGSLRLAFYSADDLERLLDLLLGADRRET